MSHIIKLTEEQLRQAARKILKEESVTKFSKNKALNEQKVYHQTYERVSHAMYESMGINDEVYKLTNELYDEASTRIDELKEKDYITIKLKINDKEFDCNIWRAERNGGFSNYEDGKRPMFISIRAVIKKDGKIDWASFKDSAQHELSHIFEQEMAGKRYPGDDLNSLVTFDIHSGDQARHNIACALYFSNPTEQTAYVNGMYSFIMKRFEDGEVPISPDEIEAYHSLTLLYQFAEYINDARNREAIDRALVDYHKFGWTYRRLKSRVNDGVKSFEYKIARGLRKCQNDLVKKGVSVTDSAVWIPDLTFIYKEK